MRILLFMIVLALLPLALSAQCNVETNYTTTDNFCAPQDSIYISLFPYGGTEPYTYMWSTGGTTQTISVLLVPSDIYFTITDAMGCSHVNYIHIKEGPYIAGIGGNYFLCGSNEATLNLFWYRFPPENVEYLWSTGATTPTINITEGGSYSVTVTDPYNGCSVEFTTYVDPPSPSIEVVNVTPAGCGQNSGAIDINVSGEYPPYIYNWSNGASTQDLNNVNAGAYIVTVTANDGCTATANITVPGGGNLTVTGTTVPNTSCTSPNGSINITPNPLGSYTYSWSNGASSEDLAALSQGIYTVTVTASGGCTSTASFNITNNVNSPVASAIQTPASCGQDNGSVNLTVTGGSSPYSFDWSNGSSTEDLINVSPGTYIVTVTDNNGCTVTASSIVSNNNAIINIEGTITPNTSCLSDNGSVNISISPSGNYSFEWNTGGLTEDITGIGQGTYTVTVTDNEGCTSTESFTVDNNPNSPALSTSHIPASCNQNNGSINLTVVGGSSPFEYNWSNGETTEDLQNLSEGTYSVTVTGSNGCSATATSVLTSNNAVITINGTVTPNTSCAVSNGLVNLNVEPAGVYSFTWSNGASSEDIANLGSGIYYVTVTNTEGCSASANFNVVDNPDIPQVSFLSTPASCGQSNGSIDLSVNGTAPFDYVWSNGETTEDLFNVSTETFIVTVTDNNGCTASETIVVSNNDFQIDINGSLTPNTSCQVPNGSIQTSITPAGSYTYLWSTGSITENLENVTGGIYSLTVTHLNGCTSVSSFTVPDQATGIVLSALTTTNTSCTNANGTIDLNVSPPGVYAFEWSTGSVSEDLSFLPAGDYRVTVTDNNLCSVSSIYTVAETLEYPVFSAFVTNELCNQSNGAIDISISSAGNIFLWSNGATTEDLNNLDEGAYHVTVTNINGCISIDTFEVINTSNSFSISGIVTDNVSCSLANGLIDITISPAGPYTFLWSNGSSTEDLQSLSEGMYVITVTDQMNCAATATFTIQNLSTELSIEEVITSATCGQSNGIIDLSITPSMGNSFLWSNGFTGEDLVNIQAGNYSVTVTASNGCFGEKAFTLSDQNNNFSINATVNDNTSCTNPVGSVILNVSPAGDYTYLWSDGSNGSTLFNTIGGTYSVTVTDISGCSAIQSYSITDELVTVTITGNITPSSCGQSNGSIDIETTPDVGNIFLWSNGFTLEDLHSVGPGTYTVTITSVTGCTSSATFEVPDLNSVFTATGIVENDYSCTGSTGSIDLTVTPSGIYTFAWSNGNTTEDLQNLAPGVYEVTITDQSQCTFWQEFSIIDRSGTPEISLAITELSCASDNGSIDLSVYPVEGNSFIWSTGETTEDIDQLTAGVYSVTVSDINGCSASGEILLAAPQLIEVNILADLSTTNSGNEITASVMMNVPVESIQSIDWFPGTIMNCTDPVCLTQTFILSDPTIINVVVTDTNGCSAEANLMLDIDKEPKVFIPNVFSPDSGESNNWFTISTNNEVEEIVILEIFNRWGDMVFANKAFPPNEPAYGWDGTYKNQLVNPDVFVYRAVVRYSNGEEHAFRGDVTLIR